MILLIETVSRSNDLGVGLNRTKLVVSFIVKERRNLEEGDQSLEKHLLEDEHNWIQS